MWAEPCEVPASLYSALLGAFLLTPRSFALAALISVAPISMVALPTAVLAQSASSISGTVVDTAGKPIGNAHVAISGPLAASVQSGADGSFKIAVPEGIYTVTVTAPGFASTDTDVVVSARKAASVAVTLADSSLTTIGRVARSSTALNKTTSATGLVTGQQLIDQGQTQVVNALDQLPGVEVFRSNGGSDEPGANTSPAIRGAEPYETQVLLDGHPANTFGNGAFGFNSTFINSLLLSDVQVGKGPGDMPNTIGNAVGGTVNFKTAEISNKLTTNVVLGHDSFDSNYYAVRVSDTFGKLGVLVGIARDESPGFLPQNTTIYGGDRNPFFGPTGSPIVPVPSSTFVPGQTYSGVINFAYQATSDYSSDAQLFKAVYKFSPETSLQLSSFSTQSFVDETGNNIGNINATIVRCITTPGGSNPVGTTCVNAPNTDPFQNYTATPYLGLVGKVVPINYYAAYPNTYETDNEPIFTGEFRTVIGPGTLLARYYAGSIDRVVNQQPAPNAIGPCYDPSCPWLMNGPGTSNSSPYAYGNDNGYPGEPYLEQTIDVLHGFDAQYTLPFGANTLTIGMDRHTDQAYFNETYNDGGYEGASASTAYQLDPSVDSTKFYNFSSSSFNVRGDFQLKPNLKLDAGAYFSNTTLVGSRFDPRIGVEYQLNADTTARASWGSTFVAPYYSLIESGIHSHTLYVPSENFVPETSTGFDLGADHKLAADTTISADLYRSTIFNRYALVNDPSLSGAGYSSTTFSASEGNAINEGLEIQILHAPKVGLGYHFAADLMRDYAYGQSVSNTGGSAGAALYGLLPDNGVQLPGYAYSKAQEDLTYAFADKSRARISGTTYGANNAYGQSGFTLLSAQYSKPLSDKLTLNVGGSNLFAHDNGQVQGTYYGGYTFNALGGGSTATDLEPVQPRTVYFQLQYATGGKSK
jgi:outer membrane receptor for ferrienterochelin and colicin